MNTKLMDECYRKRHEFQVKRFPLREFREAFVDEFSRHGVVLIQDATVSDASARHGFLKDAWHGIVFYGQRELAIALALLHRWGFEVVRIVPHDRPEDRICYSVQLPDAYLKRKAPSYMLGEMYTRCRITYGKKGKRRLDSNDSRNSNNRIIGIWRNSYDTGSIR